MKSQMRSQLEKFNEKYLKNRQDDESILDARIQQKRERLEKLLDEVRGLEELAKRGNIKHEEAGAVFTHEGLQRFGTWFGNSVSAIFQEEAVPMIRLAIREEIRNVALGFLEGFIESSLQTIAEKEIKDTIKEAAPATTVAAIIEQESRINFETVVRSQERLQIETNTRKRTRKKSISESAERIAETLRNSESPVTLKTIIKMHPEIDFGKNPSLKMVSFRKYADNIKPIGRGLYTYNMTMEE